MSKAHNVSLKGGSSAEPREQQSKERTSADYTTEELERGLAIVGVGRYNIMCILILVILLIASVMDVIGSSIILPAAKCELKISDSQRGAVSAIPYIGILLTSYIHGYLIDTRGRKRMAIYTALGAGCFSLISAFMPSLASYGVIKFMSSLCIAVPSGLPYTYISEIVPQRQRDMLLSIANALQLIGSALVPLIGWLIIPLEFEFDFGAFTFRPWRLLTIIYALFLIMASGLLVLCPESPKYLLSRGHPDKALDVLVTMYSRNKRVPRDEFPMKSLSGPLQLEELTILRCLKRQTKPLLQAKYVKYLLLNGFLLFGVFCIFNGVYIWVLDVVNRVIYDEKEDKTACEAVMDIAMMDEIENVCVDEIDTFVFMINSSAQIVCAIIGLIVSFTVVQFAGKFFLLLACYLFIGTCCIVINYITNATVFIILISAFPLIALALGPVNAYGVEIFPPHMRGMAVLLCMMLGRFGSVFSAILTGLLIEQNCEILFYVFGGLLYICAAMMYFHRPKKENT